MILVEVVDGSGTMELRAVFLQVSGRGCYSRPTLLSSSSSKRCFYFTWFFDERKFEGRRRSATIAL